MDARGDPGGSTALMLWKQFIQTSVGGAWSEDEIDVFSGSALSKSSVTRHLSSMGAVDYCAVICLGTILRKKGDRPWAETHVILNNGEEISERELNAGSARLLLLFDGGAEALAARESESDKRAATEEQRSALRETYDAGILTAESGIVSVCFVTPEQSSQNQFSLVDALVHSARGWASTHKGVLTFEEAFKEMSQTGTKSIVHQNLHYTPGRRLQHFPLAVS